MDLYIFICTEPSSICTINNAGEKQKKQSASQVLFVIAEMMCEAIVGVRCNKYQNLQFNKINSAWEHLDKTC